MPLSAAKKEKKKKLHSFILAFPLWVSAFQLLIGVSRGRWAGSVILKLIAGPLCSFVVSRALSPQNSLSPRVGNQHCNDAGLEAH